MEERGSSTPNEGTLNWIFTSSTGSNNFKEAGRPCSRMAEALEASHKLSHENPAVDCAREHHTIERVCRKHLDKLVSCLFMIW